MKLNEERSINTRNKVCKTSKHLNKHERGGFGFLKTAYMKSRRGDTSQSKLDGIRGRGCGANLFEYEVGSHQSHITNCYRNKK